jgi:hypothetical protein
LSHTAFNAERSDPRDIGYSQPQPDQTACWHLINRINLPIDRGDCPVGAAARGVAGLEHFNELTITAKTEIPDVERKIQIKPRVFVFFNDQDTGQASGPFAPMCCNAGDTRTCLHPAG